MLISTVCCRLKTTCNILTIGNGSVIAQNSLRDIRKPAAWASFVKCSGGWAAFAIGLDPLQ